MKPSSVLAIIAAAVIALASAEGPKDTPACDLGQVNTKIDALNSDDAFKQCKEHTGYKFVLSEGTPDEALMDKICAHAPCGTALQELARLDINNCTIEGVTANLPATLAGYATRCNK